MAAMTFPFNGHLLCCVNILTVLLIIFNKLAANIMSNNMIHQKEKEKRKLALINFANQLGHFLTI